MLFNETWSSIKVLSIRRKWNDRLILTGHGQFAVGVGQALEMIAGKQAAYRVVPFLESDPMDALEN